MTREPDSRAKEDLTNLHIVFVSMEDWDELWRRNQFICSEASRRSEKRRILFVGVQRNLSQRLLRGAWKSLLENPTWTVPGYPNITVTTALRVMPERYVWGRRFNEWITRTHVRRVAASLGLKQPVLWLNPHSAVHMVGRMSEKLVIYDITDDWEKVQQPAVQRAIIQAQDAELGAQADAVIVCSGSLQESKAAKFRRAVHLIPNGVDASHYDAVTNANLPIPAPAQRWQKPVLGYTGTIHAERVDLGLVVSLAQRFSHGSVVLIGPNLLNKSQQQMLAVVDNIHLPGTVPYQEIPAWMRAFDVCIVPHLVTAFTESLNPIKLWEYLAAGKPIVSTPVAGFRGYPRLVRLAGSAAGFVEAVGGALLEGTALSDERRAEARRHAWSSRVDQIEEIIRICLTK